MTPQRYSQVKSLFQLVLEQPRESRPAFLERACGADRDLYQQVRELLKADDTSEQFLDKPAVAPLSKILADAEKDAADPMPAQIGPYELQKPLGSGGMGAVYLARRADKSFDKQVAIKIIHRGMESDRILQRFRRERQIVASLDHPNIARLLDGGATPDGRPYIVMEYVDGQPIDTWCDQKRLSIDQRLRLFLQVCDAVQYAHQNLIIHRDIKPGNILVRPDSTVKLLDFGIAKLMTPEDAAKPTEKTATSMRLMTPHYASPEQVRGEAVTTASDVYLLGIVLYELLTSHRPFETQSNNPLDAIRAFNQADPQKPSDAIFRVVEKPLPNGARHIVKNAIFVAALRDADPAKLLKRIQGDLDAITLRALRRNPAERYQSAAQLAEDVRNHLQHLPISAVPDSPAYRARLFTRRHPQQAIGAAAVLLLLLGLSLSAGWVAFQARRDRTRAEANLVSAQALVNALLAGAPARRDLLDNTLGHLDRLAATPNISPEVTRQAAAGYVRAGDLLADQDPDAAINAYRKAHTLLGPIAAKDPAANAELATATQSLAHTLTATGQPSLAIPLLRADLTRLDSVPPSIRVYMLHELATALAETGSSKEAAQFAAQAHAVATAVTGTEAPELQAYSHLRLGAILLAAGQPTDALEPLRTAVRLREEIAAAQPTAMAPRRELARALHQLGAALARNGRPDEAAPLHQRAIELQQHLGSPADVTNGWWQLGNANAATAIQSFRQMVQAAAEWQRREPASYAATRTLLNAHLHLSQALAQGGESAAARESAQTAIALLNEIGAPHRDTARYRKDSARAQWILGSAAETTLPEAAKRYADLRNRNEITAEDREAPVAVDALLALCRRHRP